MTKYTREVLEPIIKSCTSINQVVLTLGLKLTGGSHSYVTKIIRDLGLDITHFTGQGYLRGTHSSNKKPWQEVLVLNRYNGRRDNPARLRRALIESGVSYTCEECGLLPKWNGKPLCLQVDHIDGNPVNNVRDNLRFICPNCHTQTSNFGSLNKVPREQKPVKKGKGHRKGPRLHRRKVDYDAVRLRYVEIGVATKVGEEFGISDVMVKRIVCLTE